MHTKESKTKVACTGPGSKLPDSHGPEELDYHHESLVSDIKLTRTDVTLRLSQKADKSKKVNRMVLDQQLKMRMLMLQK